MNMYKVDCSQVVIVPVRLQCKNNQPGLLSFMQSINISCSYELYLVQGAFICTILFDSCKRSGKWIQQKSLPPLFQYDETQVRQLLLLWQ